MKSRRHVPNLILGLGIICFAAVSIAAFAGSRAKFSQARQESRADAQSPKIVSRVKSLEVVSASVEDRDGPGATAVIEVRNNSDRAIIAIALEAGDGKDASGVSLNGFRREPPAVVLKPHGTVKMRMALSNVRPGFPIRIAGVLYADGTEEGDESALGTMRRQKEHEKNNPKKQGAPSQQ